MGLTPRASRTRRAGSIRRAGLTAALVLAGTGTLSAQGVVEAARLRADVAVDGSAAVNLVYELSDGSVAADLTLELLGFGGATAEDLVVDGGGQIVLWPATGSRRAAAISLPVSDDGARTLTLDYEVASAVSRGGGEVTVHVPIVSLPIPPTTEAGDVFEASITLPTDWRITDGFPSGLVERAPGRHEVSLPVVPAVVTVRGRSDGSRALGLGLVIDLLTVAILLGFGFIGWRHLRSLAA